MEFTKYTILDTLVAEHTNCAVDLKHTVVFTRGWINAMGEVHCTYSYTLSQMHGNGIHLNGRICKQYDKPFTDTCSTMHGVHQIDTLS